MSARKSLGESAIARSFGANVGLTMPGQGLYLVVGRYNSLPQLIYGEGGQIVLQVGVRKLLVMLPIAEYFALQRHPDIVFIGPVSLDKNRFAQLTATFKQAPNSHSAGVIR